MVSLPDVLGSGKAVHPLSDMKQGFLTMKENKLLMAVIGGVCFFLIRKYDCKTEK